MPTERAGDPVLVLEAEDATFHEVRVPATGACSTRIIGQNGTVEQRSRFVCVAKVGDPGTAQILAARLQAENIEARVHSEALGPYPLTVGQMAIAEVWVAEHAVDEARTIVMDSEIKAVLEPSRAPPWPPGARWAALAVAIVLVVAVVWRLMRVF